MFRRRVRCIDCGFVQSHFLSSADAFELPLDYRLDPTRLAGIASVSCLRRAFDLRAEEIASARQISRGDEYQGHLVDGRVETLQKPRACARWFRHRPGFTPKEHLYLEEQRTAEKWSRVWLVGATLVGTIIGVLLTIVARVLG